VLLCYCCMLLLFATVMSFHPVCVCAFVWLPCPAPTSAAALAGSLNVCGGEATDHKLSAPVHITLPHSGKSVELSFGSTLPADSDPCSASWGVDDVAVYIR
jgi:hypothetical protein